MIYYKTYQGGDEKLGNKGKWYARPVYVSTVDLEGLAEHMAAHNTPYSAGAIKGVLADMVSCIKELLLEGKKVKVTDLAIFRATFNTKGADTREKFTAKTNIRNLRLNARGTGNLKASKLDISATVREWDPHTYQQEKEGSGTEGA